MPHPHFPNYFQELIIYSRAVIDWIKAFGFRSRCFLLRIGMSSGLLLLMLGLRQCSSRFHPALSCDQYPAFLAFVSLLFLIRWWNRNLRDFLLPFFIKLALNLQEFIQSQLIWCRSGERWCLNRDDLEKDTRRFQPILDSLIYRFNRLHPHRHLPQT